MQTLDLCLVFSRESCVSLSLSVGVDVRRRLSR